MKTVYDRMMENDSYQKTKDFIIKQKWPYPQKKAYAEKIAWEFYQHPDVAGRCYVTVGGLDSITLFLFLRSIGINVPAVSVSSLEDKSIQLVHKALGIRSLPPIKDENGRPYTKMRVIQQYGYPVISKEAAQKISHLQNPTSKNATVRHAIMTGETGEYGGFKKNSRMKMSQKWLEKFGGPENENEGTNYQTAPFKVSDACCYYLKERPCDLYAKDTKCFPYLGLMASEGGRRQKSLMWNGCNYVGKKTKRSCPFAIFSRQDLLTMALEMDAYYHAHWEEFKPITVDADTGAVIYEEPIHLGTIVPAIYGEIAECGHRSEAEIQELVEANGGIMDESFSKPLLCTTLAQRTGCSNLIYERITRSFILDNYASQRGKGLHFGLDRLKGFFTEYWNKYRTAEGWVLKADVRHFFASIDHDRLKEKLKKLDLEPVVYDLLCTYIDSADGLPLGYQTSQLFALLFLDEFDHFVKERLRIRWYGRYMDDFFLIHPDKEYLQFCLKEIRAFMASLGLELNEKTQIFPLRNGIDFLGFHTYLTEQGKVIRKLRHSSIKRMRSKLRRWEKDYPAGLVSREVILQSWQAWDAHAAHGNTWSLRQQVRDRVQNILKEEI